MQVVLCPFCGSDCTYFSKKKKLYICEECEESFPMQEEVSEHSPQRIFFSYGHDNNVPLVLKLKSDLESRGHFVWIDNTEIHSGDDWRRSITDGLMSTSGVLSFLSKHSVRNPGVCLDELRIALCAKGSLVKTVLLEREEDVLPPSTLCDTQWLDMSDWRFQKEQGQKQWEKWYTQKFDELCAVIESPESQNFSGEISWLRQLLNPCLSDSKEQFLLKHTFVGREWLDNELEQWRTAPAQNGAFLLIGGPGLGKSSFAAHVLHYNPRAVCGVYCEWDKPSTTDAKSVIRTISFKLATKLPDYRKLLVEHFQLPERVKSLSKLEASELFDELLTVPLSQLIDGGRDTCMIIIDGLDEAGQNQENTLAQVLADNMCKLPRWLRLVLTSRPESEILAAFSGYKPRVLNPDEERNVQDIVAYLALNLKENLSQQAGRVEALRHIAENCHGSFLYATLLVENVLSSRMSIDDAAAFPPGLDAFYLQNFKRKFSNRSDYTGIRSALELIVAAQIIPIDLLINALGLSPYEYRDFTEQMGSLLRHVPIREGNLELEGITFCHKSVVDWLTAPNKSHAYFVDGSLGMRRLAQYCCKQLRGGQNVSDSALNAYINIYTTHFLVKGSMWQELEEFLLDSRISLAPHWRVLDSFPVTWKMDSLIRTFWTERDCISYLLDLQRKGEQSFIAFVLNLVVNTFGISELDIKSLQIFIDAVHLGGSYKAAATLCEEYLSKYSLDDIVADKELLLIAIRRLHHSMFFAPVKDLIDHALVIESKIQENQYAPEYNELLFLIGGEFRRPSWRFFLCSKME